MPKATLDGALERGAEGYVEELANRVSVETEDSEGWPNLVQPYGLPIAGISTKRLVKKCQTGYERWIAERSDPATDDCTFGIQPNARR